MANGGRLFKGASARTKAIANSALSKKGTHGTHTPKKAAAMKAKKATKKR